VTPADPSSRDPVLVTGGSGFLGSALVARLVAEGRDVRALARSSEAAAAIERGGARAVPGDVLDLGSVRAAMRGCRTVFHLAGLGTICRRDPRPLLRTNVEGSTNVVRAASMEGVHRLIHTSSGATIGEPKGAVGREDTPHRGSYLSAYERSKHLAERRVLTLAERVDLDLVCVNPSSVQGPGRTSGSATLLIRLANGRLPVAIDTTVSIVDIADCTEGHLLAETNGVRGERYLLSGAAVSIRRAVELLRRITGRPRSVRFAPGWLALGLAGAVELGARAIRAEPPFCLDAARTLVHGHRYDGSRATRELGLRYTSLEETLRRTLRWYAERGLVPAPP
jgi:dihydroflavonol-4-reductase